MWSKIVVVAIAALSSVSIPIGRASDREVREEAVIYWSPKTKLNGADFKRPPVEGSHFDAGSHLGTGMEISGAEQRLKFTIQAYFVPEKSWIKIADSSLIAHEQAHFDIEEYYARLVRIELGKMKTKGRSFDSIRKEADGIFARLLTEREAYQELFDEETGHSIHTEKEKIWEQDIKLKLLKTQDYTSPDLYFVM